MSSDESIGDEPSLKDLGKSLNDVLKAVLGVKDDLKKFKSDSANNFTELHKEIVNIKSHTSELDLRVVTVETARANLETNQVKLTYELELIKQKQLVANLCITGIKHQEGQDLNEIFSQICRCLNIECNSSELAGIYRTRGHRNTSVIVQLKNESTKRRILAAKKAKQSVIIDELELSTLTGTEKININCHLTPYFSHILYVARQAVKREEIQACWFSNKGILVRAHNDDTPILIKSAEALASLITTSTPSSKLKASDSIDTNTNPPKKVAEASTSHSASRPAKSKNQQQPNQRTTKQIKSTINKTTTQRIQPGPRNTRANSTATPLPNHTGLND